MWRPAAGSSQRPWLDTLDSWEDWDAWREAVVKHHASQTHSCCAISAMVTELLVNDPERAAEVNGHAERWCAYLTAGLRRMSEQGRLRADADPERLAVAVFAALQGRTAADAGPRLHRALRGRP